MGLKDFYQVFSSSIYGLLLKFPLQVQRPCRVSPASEGDLVVPEQCWAPACPPRALASGTLLLQTNNNRSKEFGSSVNWFLQQPHLLITGGNLENSRSVQKPWCWCRAQVLAVGVWCPALLWGALLDPGPSLAWAGPLATAVCSTLCSSGEYWGVSRLWCFVRE